MSKAKQPLHVEESVRFVMPTSSDFCHTHVARVGVPDSAVCGHRITRRWAQSDDSYNVGDLRTKWTEARYMENVHFPGRREGARKSLNWSALICSNCWIIVKEGRHPRWARRDTPPDGWCPDCWQPPQHCWCNVTLAESLAMHGFGPEEDGNDG